MATEELTRLSREELLREAEHESRRAYQELALLSETDSYLACLLHVAAAVTGELRSLRYTLTSALVDTARAQEEGFEAWARVELFGHRTLHGHVRERSVAGRRFLEIRVPSTTHERGDGEEPRVVAEETFLYAPSAVFSLDPCSEEDVLLELQQRRDLPF
jgi:hypothetical protein